MKPFARRLKLPAALAAAALLCPSLKGAESGKTFSFGGPEIFPIDFAISELHAADFDGDGLMDLVVVNNARSKINLLFNQTGKKPSPVPATTVKRQLNELLPDARFRIDSIASEKRIASLVVADLNGDGRPDLAYFGEPKELVVQYNLGTNGWSQPKRLTLDDGQLTGNALTSGDLNGDGLIDLVLLAENHAYWIAQKADHTLAEPEKIPFTGSVKSALVLDIDGNGRNDLLLINWEHANPFRFRLQNAAAQLGPEVHFPFPQIRSYWADDLDGDHKTEVMTIAMQSGRAQISNFIQKPAEPLIGPLRLGQFQVLPLNRTDKPRRGVVWADLDGDGLTDLLAAEPDSGQLTLHLQQKDGSLAAAKKFPSLTGISELAAADWDGDGKPEIFLLSADERQVGVTRLDANGRIPFPTILPLDGKPLALAVGALEAGAKPALAVILDQDGKRSLVVRSADGQTRTQKLSETFKSNPSGLAIHDADQDGAPDLIVMIPYERVKVLRQTAEKNFEELDILPPGGSVEQPWFSAADVDGDGKPELLLAQKNFLRAVVLQKDAPASADVKANWTFAVREQINGAGSNSRIVAAAPLAGTNAVPWLFLLDAERKTLTLCERDAAGVWQPVRNLPLPVTDFTVLRAISLGGTEPNAIAFVGQNGVAWLPFSGTAWEIQELDSYETPIKDGRLNDVVSGDLNQDGRKDLVFLETAKNHLDIVTFDAPHRLTPAARWQVFEERTFRNRRSDAPEPREALIVDVTGDGKNDLVVLVHDRILVYPQE
jgi:hypothetical protein